MKKAYFLFRTFCVLSLFVILPSVVYASHIVGADLYYAHITGNTYQVSLALYGDCGPASAAAFGTLPISAPQVCVFDGSAGPPMSLSLVLDTPTSGVEITPLCPGDTSQCSSPTSVIPGVKKFVYSTTVTLPHTSATWQFSYYGNNGVGATAGRAAAITNVTAAASTYIQLVDTLNNSVVSNTSPSLTVSQQTFFCVLQHDTYSPGAVDPDGDSLVFSLVSAHNGPGGIGTCTTPGSAVGYVGTSWPGMAVSAATPLEVVAADSFSLDPSTGELFFHPYYQRAIVVYNIREFRSGVFVGSSQREMTVYVVSCDSLFPCMYTPPSIALGVNKAISSSAVTIYPNPAADELTVSISGKQYTECVITNSVGQSVLQAPAGIGRNTLDISNLPAGLYFVTLTGNSGSIVQKFVKM